MLVMRRSLLARTACYAIVSVINFTLVAYLLVGIYRTQVMSISSAARTLLEAKQVAVHKISDSSSADTVQQQADASAGTSSDVGLVTALQHTPEGKALTASGEGSAASALPPVPRVTIVYAACGESGMKQLLVALTSLYYMAQLTDREYHVFVLTKGAVQEQHLRPFKSRVNIHLRPVSPLAPLLFRECATERLYLGEHEGLKELSDVIYADVDTLWTADPALMAEEFDKMAPGTCWGLSHESDATGPDQALKCKWYIEGPGVALDAYKPGGGLNTGVLLARLDIIRASNFSAQRDIILETWGQNLLLGDQDVFNIYFKNDQTQLHVLPCTMNYKSECECALAARQLPIILHGNARLLERTAVAEHQGVGRAYANQYAMFEQLYQELLERDQRLK